MPEASKVRDKIRGCLFGGASGDALGYPVELLPHDEIRKQYGEKGIMRYSLDSASHRALISDDTQMTLFTANGILFWETRGSLKGIAASVDKYIVNSYKDWLWTQYHIFGEKPDSYASWLLDIPQLYVKRAPGSTCVAAIIRRDAKDSPESFITAPVNDSKGCGGLMRVAPIGLKARYIHDPVYAAAEVAAITHSHPLGYITAGLFAQMINCIVFENKNLSDALQFSIRATERRFGQDKHFTELTRILDKAVELSENNLLDSVNIRQLGEGWVAEEALAISVYCALRHHDSFSDGILAAVNHGGASGSTGAITGNILGALLGYARIPGKWKRNLELSDVVLDIADDLDHGCVLIDEFTCDREWESKYVVCSILKGPQFDYDGESQIWLKNDESKKLRYIRHTFHFCPIKAVDDPDEKKTVTKIFPDGIVEISEYSGKKDESFIRKQVSKEELLELINRLNTCDYYPTGYCDAMSHVSYVFEDGKFRHYNYSPVCLDDFVEKLEYNTHYVIKVDV